MHGIYIMGCSRPHSSKADQGPAVNHSLLRKPSLPTVLTGQQLAVRHGPEATGQAVCGTACRGAKQNNQIRAPLSNDPYCRSHYAT